MTLRELIQSVDAAQYSDSPIFQRLLIVKPEYGLNRKIEVKLLNGEIAVSNVHVGSSGDIATCPIDVAPNLKITKVQFLMPSLKSCPQKASVSQDNPTFGMK